MVHLIFAYVVAALSIAGMVWSLKMLISQKQALVAPVGDIFQAKGGNSKKEVSKTEPSIRGEYEQ